jgi:putative aldouronate transport system permease protein
MGYGALIYYATLMGVNKELFEAAKIDGANKWQQTRYISVPVLIPMITIMFTLSVGKIMYSDFGLFYNLTLNSTALYPTTDVIDTFVYRSLIDIGDIGMSSAAGFYQSVFGFILVIISNFLVKKFDEDNALF